MAKVNKMLTKWNIVPWDNCMAKRYGFYVFKKIPIKNTEKTKRFVKK